MEIRYQFFEDENLLIQKFIGLFSHEFYIKNIGQINKDLKTKDIKKVIIDFRDLKFSNIGRGIPDDFEEGLNKIVNFRKEFNQNVLANKEVKLVILVDKPLPTVIAHLFVDSFSNSDYSYCAGEADAIEIIDVSPDFKLSLKIKNLKNKISEF